MATRMKSLRMTEPPFPVPLMGPGPALICDSNHALSGLARKAQGPLRPDKAGAFDKEKALTLDRGLFDQRLQMRFSAGRPCNDYARISRKRQGDGG
jgi:hypothetical protein